MGVGKPGLFVACLFLFALTVVALARQARACVRFPLEHKHKQSRLSDSNERLEQSRLSFLFVFWTGGVDTAYIVQYFGSGAADELPHARGHDL